MGRLGTDGDENKRNQVGDDGEKECWEKFEIGEQLSGATQKPITCDHYKK